LDVLYVLEEEKAIVEQALARCLPASDVHPRRIHEAIRYATLGGGKRLRPIIVRAAAGALGHDPDLVTKAACAVECVHCSSLVLDDLPSMDDAPTRRGRPSTHRQFDVATAILAAHDLLMHAVGLVVENGIDVASGQRALAKAIRELSAAVGAGGMVGGQHVDLEVAGDSAVDPETLEYIQSRKTASLFVAAARGGAILLGADEARLEPLSDYARCLGLAYQIVDDLLDAEGDPETVGKETGKDAGRITFVTVHGSATAKDAAAGFVRTAHEALDRLDGETRMLREIADFCLSRSH